MDYVPVHILLEACNEADEREGGQMSTTLVRLIASVHKVSDQSAAIRAVILGDEEPSPTLADIERFERMTYGPEASN